MAIKISKNKFSNIEASINKEEPKLEDKESIICCDFYFTELYDPKELTKFIKACEGLIRRSDGYSKYIGDLRNDKGLHYCAVRGNITDDDASIEFHHYPFTLYDITNIIVTDKIINDEKFNSFSICNEVLRVHSLNMVGLVPLSITEHQLVHDGVRFIPFSSVYGNINEFINTYYDAISDDLIENYNELINISASMEGDNNV